MKYLTILLFIFNSSLSYSQESNSNKILSNANFQHLIKKDDVTVVLISSLTCGYCIKDINFNNNISKQFSDKNINFVMLLEEDLNFITREKGLKKISTNWLIVPNAHNVYKDFWELEMFPEVHVFKKGKKVTSFIDASEETKSNLVNYLKKIK